LLRSFCSGIGASAIVHLLLRESHVGRSIHVLNDFVHTNVNGTFNLLEGDACVLDGTAGTGKGRFRFLAIFRQMKSLVLLV